MDSVFDSSSSDDTVDELLLMLLTISSTAKMMERKSQVGLDLVESSAKAEIEKVDTTLFRDYFAPSSTYNSFELKRRFCLKKERILGIMTALQAIDPIFSKKEMSWANLGSMAC
jgi:hypothetical protein